MDFFGRAKTWDKPDESPVTEADLAVDKLIRGGLEALFPEDGILSEELEDSDERLGRDFVWILDPIDGTKEFIAGRNDFCVMLGLVHKQHVCYSFVAIPATGELFEGGPGIGLRIEKKWRRMPGGAECRRSESPDFTLKPEPLCHALY